MVIILLSCASNLQNPSAVFLTKPQMRLYSHNVKIRYVYEDAVGKQRGLSHPHRYNVILAQDSIIASLFPISHNMMGPLPYLSLLLCTPFAPRWVVERHIYGDNLVSRNASSAGVFSHKGNVQGRNWNGSVEEPSVIGSSSDRAMMAAHGPAFYCHFT